MLWGALAIGCSDAGGGDLGARPGAPAPPPSPDAKCTTGATRQCKIIIGEEGGVLTCYQGTQLCTEGAWGECGEEGELVKVPMPVEALPDSEMNEVGSPATLPDDDG